MRRLFLQLTLFAGDAAPWWQSWWFGLACGLAVVCSLLALHHLRVRGLRRRAATLAEINDRLEKEIAERLRVEEELAAKNAELESFNYAVSHDLKSPLITIKGFLGYLEEDALAGNHENLRQDIDRINGATDRMGQLLDDLLDLSQAGRVIGEVEEVSFEELASLAVEANVGAIAERGVEVEIAAGLPAIHGDRPRLLEVVQNLVTNAVRYSGDQPRPRIDIGAWEDFGETVCYVRDNGIGIEEAYREKIFALFERLDPDVEGTGIGLALVKRIIDAHGGRVWVESQGLGKGSTFFFTLPVR